MAPELSRSQTDKTPTIFPKTEGLTRRELLMRTGKTFGILAGSAAALRGEQILDFIGIIPEIEHKPYPLADAVSQYTQASLDKTHIIVSGDSVAQGFSSDHIPTYSAGEIVRDTMNDTRGLGKNWTCTVLARNGDVIDDVMTQLDHVPDITEEAGDKDVDIFLSVGGNDLGRYIATKKDEITSEADAINAVLFHGADYDITREITDIADKYRNRVIPKLTEVKVQLEKQGTRLNRVAFINLPDLSKTRFEMYTGGETIIFDPYKDGGTILKALGRHLPDVANKKIGEALQEGKRILTPGTDFILLDAYGLPSGSLRGIHPTIDGQRGLAYQYLGKMILPPEEVGGEKNVTVLAKTIR